MLLSAKNQEEIPIAEIFEVKKKKKMGYHWNKKFQKMRASEWPITTKSRLYPGIIELRIVLRITVLKYNTTIRIQSSENLSLYYVGDHLVRITPIRRNSFIT